MTEIQTIPLSQLRSSPRNVRKTGGAAIEQLAASILAHGLLQNLSVVPAHGGFEVVAGNRRLRALQSLKQDGTLPADLADGIPCRLVALHTAHEASLAENVVREAMHPADEFEAFRALADDGHTVAEIALRFGTSERHVQQRLKLANVAPELIDDYRAGDATLEQLMALALTDDQERQRKVWNSARGQWGRRPDELRSAIAGEAVEVGSSLGKFVGLKAYEAAGGAVRRDLFSEDGDAYLEDTALVSELALQKLERRADQVRQEGWLWVESRLQFDYVARNQFAQVYPKWEDGKQVWTDAVKESAGAVVTLGHNGKAEVVYGLVRPEDRRAAAKAKGGNVVGGKKEKKPGELSATAVMRLQAEANAAVRIEVAHDPHKALALLVAELAFDALYNRMDMHEGRGSYRQWVQVGRSHSGRAAPAAREILDSEAWQELEDEWRGRMPSVSGLRQWALQASDEYLMSALAFLVARELEVIDAPGGRHDNGIRDVAKELKIDLRKHWRPTEDWLGSLPKPVLIAQVRDAAGKKAAAPLEKLSKAQLPGQALPLFPPGWLPKELRAPEPVRKPRAPRGKMAAAGDVEAEAQS